MIDDPAIPGSDAAPPVPLTIAERLMATIPLLATHTLSRGSGASEDLQALLEAAAVAIDACGQQADEAEAEVERCQLQVEAYRQQHHALGQHIVATHKPGEVDHEAVAILDGYHVGAREVAGGGHGEPGETTLEAALRLLKLAHARGAFAVAEHVVTPEAAPAKPTFRSALIDSTEALPDWVDADEFKDANFEDGYRACVAVQSNGKVRYHWDCGEPEDNLYLRDWSWVAPALANAYEAGFDETRS